VPLFCRHNRYTADCPICSKGTVLDPNRGRSAPRRSSSSGPSPARQAPRPATPHGATGSRVARVTVGPHAAAGPYEHEDGTPYEVRLERVPGGLRLGSWSRGALERRAPVLPGFDLPVLVREAVEREVVAGRDGERLLAALSADGAPAEADAPLGASGTSAGRSGELREELRVERMPDEHVRIARWLFRPGSGEWDLQDAPPMLPAARYAEALGAAVRAGVVALA
jgi:hypothetical protein